MFLIYIYSGLTSLIIVAKKEFYIVYRTVYYNALLINDGWNDEYICNNGNLRSGVA